MIDTTDTKAAAPAIELSPDQEDALEKIMAWMAGPSQSLTLGGYAGTGKTTLIKKLIGMIPDVRVVAFTGKAVSVLRSKGVAQAGTCHSLFYDFKGKTDDKDPIFRRKKKGDIDTLVIVDEASMIDGRMHDDLLQLCPKLLFIGDHGQLSPIGYDPGLMRDPEIRLEKIHRQAAHSGIIRFASHLREGNQPQDFSLDLDDVHIRGYTPSKVKGEEHSYLNDIELMEHDVFLCYTNRTRHAINKAVRETFPEFGLTKEDGFDVPEPGETLICLANDKRFGIMNGQQFIVKNVVHIWTDHRGYSVADIALQNLYELVQGAPPTILPVFLPQLGPPTRDDDPEWRTKSYGKACYNDEDLFGKYAFMDWGYALTTHKSQGSSFPKVCVIEESIHTSPARWRYTAVTRASKEVTYYAPQSRVFKESEISPAMRRLMDRKRGAGG